MDLTTISCGNYMLSSGFTILHVGDLSRSMTTSLSHSLNCCNNFLILPILIVLHDSLILSFNSSFVLIDLQLKHSLIGPGSTAIRAPVDTLAGFIVYGSFAGRLVRHLGLSTLRWINSAGHWTLWSILITDLQLLETIVQIRTLTILYSLRLQIFLQQFFAAVRLAMTIGAVRCILAVLYLFVILLVRLRLLLDLRVELSELDGIRILTLELLVHLAKLWNLVLELVFLLHQKLILLFRLFELGLNNIKITVDSGDLTLLLVKQVLDLFLELLLVRLSLLLHSLFQLIFFLVELFDSLIQHLNMQFQLLFHFNMVSNFSLILLKLLFVFLGR